MILFFRTPTNSVIATECNQELNAEDVKKLCWLYSDATVENEDNLKGWFIGPRREMITPWSTNAVEITQNMGLNGIRRIEEYFPVKDENADHDPMLQRMYHGLDQETVLKLNILLNTSLNGLTMDQINLTTIAKIKEEAGIHSEVVNSVLDAVAEAIQMDEEEMEIYTSGATNIFKYPELSDSEKASSLIGTFEEKKQLADLVADTMADDKNTGIQVYIGNETPVQTMKECSVVTATYELGDGMRGTIGIIGPKRMDYDRVVGTLKTLTTQLDDIFGKKKEDN